MPKVGSITPQEELRRRRGFGVVEFARLIGYSHVHVSRVEGGHERPSPRYRQAAAAALGVDEAIVFPDEVRR